VQTIELKPDFSKGYSRKGSALHGKRDYEESVEAYRKGLEIDPSSALLKKGLDEVEKAMERDGEFYFISLDHSLSLGRLGGPGPLLMRAWMQWSRRCWGNWQDVPGPSDDAEGQRSLSSCLSSSSQSTESLHSM
jgi:tetratricopeptide (TPR) repeat protein